MHPLHDLANPLRASLSAGAVALAAGGYHTCALLTGGDVECWGNNGDGQIGTGDNNNRFDPTLVAGLGAGASALVWWWWCWWW